MNVGSLVARHARYRGQHVALVVDDTRLRFDELGARVNQLANAFQAMGLVKGDALAIVMQNSLDMLVTYWAGVQNGLVLVPLSPLLRGAALAALLRDADSAAVVLSDSMADRTTAALSASRSNAARAAPRRSGLSGTSTSPFCTPAQ